MENTESLFFDIKESEGWFYSTPDGNYVGPVAAVDIAKKLSQKELNWVDYAYHEKLGKWARIADLPVFKSLQPQAPKPVPKAPPPPPVLIEETKWFLYQSGVQTGPYKEAEVLGLIAQSRVQSEAFVWNENLSGWVAIKEAQPFAASWSEVPVEKTRERRAYPRKPMTAQVYLTNSERLSLGLCRDLSIGGMQVLTDDVPGDVGTKVRLNVMPPLEVGISPFVAEGVVVRILEDKRGFSFRFVSLSSDAKRAIEKYIQDERSV